MEHAKKMVLVDVRVLEQLKDKESFEPQTNLYTVPQTNIDTVSQTNLDIVPQTNLESVQQANFDTVP